MVDDYKVVVACKVCIRLVNFVIDMIPKEDDVLVMI